MKKITTTICIPAYNEEANIQRLLIDVSKQHHHTYTLEKILVISDGSTDNTVRLAKEIKDKRIHVLAYIKRLGKVHRINSAVRSTTSDVFIQLDADIQLNDLDVIDHLMKPFTLDSSIGMTCGSHMPLPPNTFIEKIGYFGELCWSSAVDMLGKNDGLYRCYGHIRAMSRSYYSKFSLPLRAGSAEDTYSFYFAMKHGYTVKYVPHARVSYRLPSTLGDYIKQMSRFQNEQNILSTYFDSALMSQYETMNTRIKLLALIKALRVTSPEISVSYIIIQTLIHLLPKQIPSTTGIWDVSISTKRI